MSETTNSNSAVKVTVFADGPLMLTGNIEICDAQGNVVRTSTKLSLCRCGRSDIKPYCDGSHKRQGFTAPTATS